MSAMIEEYKLAHARIEIVLQGGEALVANLPALIKHLAVARPEVVQHFLSKDAFYPLLAEQCTKAGDSAGAHLSHIFESNMRVQSAAVRRFFESVEIAQQASLLSSFQTVVTVIRQRFSTEERAIFPLFVRTAKAAGAHS